MCGAKERPDQFLTRDRVPKSARSLCRAFIITESVFFVYFGANKAWGFLPQIFSNRTFLFISFAQLCALQAVWQPFTTASVPCLKPFVHQACDFPFYYSTFGPQAKQRKRGLLSEAAFLLSEPCLYRCHQMPMTFHQTGPRPRKQIMKRIEQMKPTFHHSGCVM